MDEAIKKFDVSKGLRLISYAVHWIKQRGYKQMSELNVIRDPQHYWLYKEQIKKRMVEKGRDLGRSGRSDRDQQANHERSEAVSFVA